METMVLYVSARMAGMPSDSPHRCACLQIARRTSLYVTQRKSSSPGANDGANPPRIIGSMAPPPTRSGPSRRNNVQVGHDSRRVLTMQDIQQFYEDNMAMIGSGPGAGSAQNVIEYNVKRPVDVDPTHLIRREPMPAIFYTNILYPHFYADSMAAPYTRADQSVREGLQLAAAASAPFNQGCHFLQPYSPGCLLPTIVPAVELEAYMQQHYSGDQNIATCWFTPGFPLESWQGSSSFFMEGYSGDKTAVRTRQRSGLIEHGLLSGCEVSGANDRSIEEQVQVQTSAIVEEVVCVGDISGVGRAEAQRPAARARRGGSGFQSAQNISIPLVQAHPAVGQVPLVIPDPLTLRAKKKQKGIAVDSGLTISPNQASYLASASSSRHIPTRVATSAPTLTAPNGSRPSPPKSNDQVIEISSNSRMAANLSAGDGDRQKTTVMTARFMRALREILQEVCHLPIVQQARQRPGHPAVRQIGGRLSVEGEAFDPAAAPRVGSARAPAANLPATVIELETEKQKLLKLLEEVTKKHMLHTERLERLTKQFNAQTGEGMAEMYTENVRLTLTRNFGTLKNAILRRLRAVRGALGEDTRFVFRAAQPGALVPQASNDRTPQRGHPENAVWILRRWLFERFLHPYPQDNDKTELANQTGLSRSQVSNWFINARVRLWKPMVEEMYKDELMREGAGECEGEIEAEAEREASTGPIGKPLDMNPDVQASIEPENTDHKLTDDHSGKAGIGQVQRPAVQLGVNELGLIHVYNAGECSSPHKPDDELEMFLTMPEEFAQVDNRLRPAMPLKICKREPKDT